VNGFIESCIMNLCFSVSVVMNQQVICIFHRHTGLFVVWLRDITLLMSYVGIVIHQCWVCVHLYSSYLHASVDLQKTTVSWLLLKALLTARHNTLCDNILALCLCP